MKATPVRLPVQSGSSMPPSDAFFWYAEAAMPQLRPLVAGLFMLERAPERRRFRASIERLIACTPRLRQRVVDAPLPLGLPRWEDDAEFDLDYHLRTVVVPQPADQRHLFEFAGAVFATPLDHLRPLWEGYLLEGLEGGRAALFLKLHHAVMDGVGSVALFDALTQAGPDDPVRMPRARLASQHDLRPAPNRLWETGAAAAGAVAHAIANPGETFDQAVRTARSVARIVGDLTTPTATDPLAARCTGIGRRLDGLTLSLSRLRRIKSALGITLNDLVLTIVSGALGRYHAQRGLRLKEVQCIVPMSVRQDHERHTAGNRVTAFALQLPVGERDPFVRLAKIRHHTGAGKGDKQGALYGVLMQAVALIPAAVFRAMARTANGRIHLICSNVAGPPVQRYLAGARVDAVYPFAPLMLGVPLSIALVSYGDNCTIGIDSDPAAIPDPERLRVYLEQETSLVERRALPRAVRAVKSRPAAAATPDLFATTNGRRAAHAKGAAASGAAALEHTA